MSAKQEKSAIPEGLSGIGISIFGKVKSDSTFLKVPINRVHVEKEFNPRTKVTGVEELSKTLKATGIIPITVRPGDKENHYNIVDGERRYRAASLAGFTEIPIILRTDLENTDEARAVAAALNSEGGPGRMELPPVDRGSLYKALQKKKWTIGQIAKKCGAHDRDVRRCIELVEAPEKIQKLHESGKLAFHAALEVAKYDSKTQDKVLNDIDDVELTMDEIKRRAKQANKKEDKSGNKSRQKQEVPDPVVWKGKKDLQAQACELAWLYLQTEKDDIGTAEYHETRGALAFYLWQRNELSAGEDAEGNPIRSFPSLPPEDPATAEDPKAAAKEKKRIDVIIKAMAKSYTPQEQPVEVTPEDAAKEAELVGAGAE